MDDTLELVGETVAGRLSVLAPAGRGGFSVVYRAWHLGLERIVALKCMSAPARADASLRTKLLEQFRAEAQYLHDLATRGADVVRCLDVDSFTHPRTGVWIPYLVLEWLEGRTLEELLVEREATGGAWSLAEAMELLNGPARALAIAHDHGVVHRDLKPSNVMVQQRNGRQVVKLLDFGIAKSVAPHAGFTGAVTDTVTSLRAFTPAYAAPEQFDRSLGATGPWTDVFALGLLVTELVTGRRPLSDEPMQAMYASTDPSVRPTPASLGVPQPPAVEAVLRRALTVQPRARYRTVGEFWRALRTAAARPPAKPSPPRSRGIGDAAALAAAAVLVIAVALPVLATERATPAARLGATAQRIAAGAAGRARAAAPRAPAPASASASASAPASAPALPTGLRHHRGEGFGFDAPDDLLPAGEPTRGAVALASATGALLVARGVAMTDGSELEAFWSEATQVSGGRRVTYQVKRQRWFAASGYEPDGRIFYTKAVGSDARWAVFTLVFRPEDRARYQDWIAPMEKSLRLD